MKNVQNKSIDRASAAELCLWQDPPCDQSGRFDPMAHPFARNKKRSFAKKLAMNLGFVPELEAVAQKFHGLYIGLQRARYLCNTDRGLTKC